MVDWKVGAADLNGDFYTGSLEGENLEENDVQKIIFRTNMPSAPAPLQDVNFNDGEAALFMRDNVAFLVNAGVAAGVANQIAYVRLVAAKKGLVSPEFDVKVHNVRYNDARRVTNAVAAAWNYNHNNGDSVSALFKAEVRARFTDWVCLVAYIFRARGHHYLEGLAEVHTRVWNHCQYDPAANTLGWEHISRHCLHAIMPDVLEDFWRYSVQQGHCNGALIKRYDCSPAGAAAAYVLDSHLRDMLMIAPGLEEKLTDEIKYLRATMDVLRAHRYNGSVNAAYYGATRLVYEEKKMAATAATLMAALNGLAPDSDLLNSAALKRVAKGAPLTGAVFATAIRRVGQSENLVAAITHVPDT